MCFKFVFVVKYATFFCSQKSAINYLQSAEHKMNVIAANGNRHLSPQMMRNKPTNLH